MRMNFLTIFIVGFTSSFCIVYKGQTNPVLLAMLLSYIINLSDLLTVIVYMLGQTQRQMVNVQRCLNILEYFISPIIMI